MRRVRRLATVSHALACATVFATLTACKFEPAPFSATGPRDALDDTTSPPGDGNGTDGAATDAPPTPIDASIDALVVTLACPTSYTLTNAAEPGSKYRLVTASDDWAGAELDCANDGGGAFAPTHMVVLDDEAERDWVYDQGTTDKWVGATDVNVEGTYEAITDQPTPYFGTPQSNNQSKDCMFINQTATVMEACSAGFQYICECDGRAADPTNFGG